MAKPDCCDGWIRYAHELDAALSVADFTKVARIVLHEVLEQVYGPPKLRSASLSPTDLGALVGIAKSNIARGVRELLEAKVLSRLGDGTYRFHKDYAAWEKNGQKRLSTLEVKFCRSAPARAVARGISTDGKPVINSDNPSKPVVIDPDNSAVTSIDNASVKSVIDPDNHPPRPVISIDNAPLSELITPPKNPLLGRVLENSRDDSEASRLEPTESDQPRTNTLHPTPGPTMAGGTFDVRLAPPYPAEGTMLFIQNGPNALTPKAAREVYEKLWIAFGNPEVCRDFYEQQRLYPASVWIEAARSIWKKGVRARSLTIVKNRAGELTVGKPPRRNEDPFVSKEVDPEEQARRDAAFAASL